MLHCLARTPVRLPCARDSDADARPGPQFQQIKADNPYGFDIVVEATGSVKILEDAIHYVRRGGKLVVYGVYADSARVSWPPSKIFGDEITIIGSFSETHKCEWSGVV